jgi:hypothetical protein
LANLILYTLNHVFHKSSQRRRDIAETNLLSIFSKSKDLENVAKMTVMSLERLLEKASADLAEKNANVTADGEGAKASVVWILGNDQGLNLNSEENGQSAMDHLFKILDNHIEKNPSIALIVVLAAEQVLDRVQDLKLRFCLGRFPPLCTPRFHG